MSINAVESHLAGKKVLVTGATGFMGSHLVERLVSLGAQVTAVGPSLGWRPIVEIQKGAKVRFRASACNQLIVIWATRREASPSPRNTLSRFCPCRCTLNLYLVR